MQGLLLAGRYRLGESIGRGGMGRVWRAHDEVLHRVVAVKELTAAEYAPDNDRRILLARTQTEARAAARINHPAVVTIHDVLEHDDRPWIVMELVEGVSLADAVRDSGPLDAPYAARVGLWVLRALRAAHAAGVLHRDVKPGNVLLADDGRVLLTDFGIAHMEGDTTLTKTGEIVGSVDYLAPERVRGADPEPACDLWALGATLYTAVDGRSPFRRGTPLATMQAVVDDELPEPESAGPLGVVITALLHKDPAIRPTADEAEAMLAEAAEGRRPTFHPDQYEPPTHRYETPQPYEAPQPYDHTHTAHRPAPPAPSSAFIAPAAAAPPAPYGQDPYGPPYGPYHPPGVHGPGRDTPTPRAGEYRPAAGRARRGWSVVAAVVAAVALLAGGTALGLHYAGGDDQGTPQASADPSQSGPPSPSPSKSGRPPGSLPKGWVRKQDPKGFSLAVPENWQREVHDGQIDYTPDHGNHFVRISVDPSPDWDSPYLHQLDLERQLHTLVDYRRIELKTNTFRDQAGSLWEFTWTARPKDGRFPGPRHAIEQTYFGPKNVEYAIYMSVPQPGWATAQQQFRTVMRSWRS